MGTSAQRHRSSRRSCRWRPDQEPVTRSRGSESLLRLRTGRTCRRYRECPFRRRSHHLRPLSFPRSWRPDEEEGVANRLPQQSARHRGSLPCHPPRDGSFKLKIPRMGRASPSRDFRQRSSQGSEPPAWQIVHDSPDIEDVWQLHYAAESDKDHNVADDRIANVKENCEGKYLKVSAQIDGSFTVTNARTGQEKTYSKR